MDLIPENPEITRIMARNPKGETFTLIYGIAKYLSFCKYTAGILLLPSLPPSPITGQKLSVVSFPLQIKTRFLSRFRRFISNAIRHFWSYSWNQEFPMAKIFFEIAFSTIP
ncbi:hypothetical protein CEXT_584351 [Caerostris extrusa]|uniref:Uncharacterized protein n=1 Tax=Caerostris extrusa TaxID=172846 RepID=A0AAV4XD01_CAEEX|nr:hypothetical protein CEXT_584351 [Caerostris extrusa]